MGNTRMIAEAIELKVDSGFLDIGALNITPYDYEHRNQNDDFIPVFEQIVRYKTLIFVTPVYWYSMAGPMKVFFDRMTDLLTIRKDLGRSLTGKGLAAVCCSSDKEEYPGFFMPFARTAAYLNMEYLGACHTWIADDRIPELVADKLDKFCAQINNWIRKR